MATRLVDTQSNINPPDSNYPDGSFKNATNIEATDGSSLDENWGNDIQGMQQSLMKEANISPSGVVDTANTSQIKNAMKVVLGGAGLYQADIDYPVDSYAKGSDGNIYRCLIANGPLSTAVDPVGDLTGTWIENTPIVIYDTVADMKLATIPAGQLVETKGYYEAGDGGGGRYLIKDTATVDGYVDHELAGGTFAVLQYEGKLNVKQAGAKGDGVTDDTAAVQAAINYANVIYFPNHIYAVSSTGSMVFYDLSNKRLIGDTGATLLKLGSKGIFSIYDCNNISFDNLIFDGNVVQDELDNGSILDGTRASTDYSFAIHCQRGTEINIQNCTFTYFSWDGVVFKGDITDPANINRISRINIEKCTFSYTRGAMVWLKATSNVSINNCSGYNSSTFQQKSNFIFVVDWNTGCNITNNSCYYIGDNAVGIGQMDEVVQEAVNAKIKVVNNSFKTTRYHTILVAQGDTIEILGNMLQQAGAKDNMIGGADTVLCGAIYVLGGDTEPANRRVTIVNNIIEQAYEIGIFVEDRPGTSTFSDKSTEIKICNNTITDTGSLSLSTRIMTGGIYLKTPSLVDVGGNTITATVDGDAIRCYGPAHVHDNYICGGIVGVFFLSDTLFGTEKIPPLVNNYITKTHQSGVYVYNKNSIVLIGNTVENCGIAATTLDAAGALQASGIVIRQCANINISRCYSSSNGAAGIMIQSFSLADSTAMIQGCETNYNGLQSFPDNYRSGIFAEGDSGYLLQLLAGFCSGVAGGSQQYPIRVVYGNNSTALDCIYDSHPHAMLGCVAKNSIDIP